MATGGADGGERGGEDGATTAEANALKWSSVSERRCRASAQAGGRGVAHSHASPKAVALDVKAWMTSSNTRKECSQRPLEAGAAWEEAAGGGGHVPVATAPASVLLQRLAAASNRICKNGFGIRCNMGRRREGK